MNSRHSVRSHHIGAPLRAALLTLSMLALALSAAPRVGRVRRSVRVCCGQGRHSRIP